MKARITGRVYEPLPIYTVKHKTLQVHGYMRYMCKRCQKQWNMSLEIGVEDNGKSGRPHQPCPFIIPCECGGLASDISGYVPYPEIRELISGQKYFAYDNSGKKDACGIPTIFIEKEGAEE
jgi:hypothetical protein